MQDIHDRRPCRFGFAVCALALSVLTLGSAELSAQLPQARLLTVFPAGGQRGTAVDLTTISGVDLDELSALYFTHPGITAAPKTTMVDGKPQPVPGQFTVTIAADVPPAFTKFAPRACSASATRESL